MQQFFVQQPSMNAITSKSKQNQQQQSAFKIQCRICLSQQYQIDNKFINPCACRGSIKYAHLNCLSAWILKLQQSMDFRKTKAVVCQLCKYKIKYVKIQRSACCSKEEYLHKIQQSRVLFITLVAFISVIFISLVVMSYYLQDKIAKRNEEQQLYQIIVITLFLTLSLCLEIALVTILVTSFFIKKVIQVTSIEQSKKLSAQCNQTYDNLKPQTYYTFSFI